MPLLKSDRASTSEKRQLLRGLWLLFNIGWFVALSLIIPTAIGLWLDAPERLNTRPLCSLIGFVLGTLVAAYGLFRTLRRFAAEQKDMNKQKNSTKEQDNG
jgi:hypothetical protein